MSTFQEQMKNIHNQNFNPEAIVQFQNFVNYIDRLLVATSQHDDANKKIELLVLNYIKLRDHMSRLIAEFGIKNMLYQKSLEVSSDYDISLKESKKKQEPLTGQNRPQEKE